MTPDEQRIAIAEAACAELRSLCKSAYSAIIEHHSSAILREGLIECPFCTTKRGGVILTRLHVVYSSDQSDCGRGWLSPERAKRLREALREIINYPYVGETVSMRMVAEQALAETEEK